MCKRDFFTFDTAVLCIVICFHVCCYYWTCDCPTLAALVQFHSVFFRFVEWR
jgi:hypothetical protein